MKIIVSAARTATVPLLNSTIVKMCRDPGCNAFGPLKTGPASQKVGDRLTPSSWVRSRNQRKNCSSSADIQVSLVYDVYSTDPH